jgi:hypothetical protein
LGADRYVWGNINRKIGVEGSRFRGAEGKREKSRVQGVKESRVVQFSAIKKFWRETLQSAPEFTQAVASLQFVR